MRTRSRKTVLFLFAHQDDECFLSIRIRRELEHGHDVHCVYFTDGAGYGLDPAIRDAETRRVLLHLGLNPSQIHLTGSQAGVPDGGLTEHLPSSLAAVKTLFDELPVRRLYCLAYEGGHPDHDAAYLIALAYARHRGLVGRTWQIASYNGAGRWGPFFRVQYNLPLPLRRVDLPVGPQTGLRDVWLATQYPSQWKSFMGLFPGHFLTRVVKARETVQAVSAESALARPHEGRLLYERRYGVSYESFRESTASFVAREILPGPGGDRWSRV